MKDFHMHYKWCPIYISCQIYCEDRKLRRKQKEKYEEREWSELENIASWVK